MTGWGAAAMRAMDEASMAASGGSATGGLQVVQADISLSERDRSARTYPRDGLVVLRPEPGGGQRYRSDSRVH